MTPSLALYVMAQSPAMHEMTQSLAMRVMTQSLAMHVMTLGQTVCGQQVDRQHQDLCTVHALTWQMGHQSQACEQLGRFPSLPCGATHIRHVLSA